MTRLLWLAFVLSSSLVLCDCSGHVPNLVISQASPLPAITPTQFLNPPQVNETAPLTLLPTGEPAISYWFNDSIPYAVQTNLCFPEGMVSSSSKSQASVWLEREQGEVVAYRKVYALAGRFNLLVDNLSLSEIQDAWTGHGKWKLQMSTETYADLSLKWGDTTAVLFADRIEDLIQNAWNSENLMIILPFDELVPRLKVLKVDEFSVLDKDLDVEMYPLVVDYNWVGDQAALDWIETTCRSATNRNLNLMTDVLMTGVTALTRGTAAKMAEAGILYPAKDVLNWLKQADVAHISHEVSFFEDCPDPLPIRAGGRFCAQPEFLELFQFSGIDVIELTGNHLNDWGTEAFEKTITMYHEVGILTFGGGVTAELARQPLLIDHNGNQLAFLGCNATGPESDWATDLLPGSARCDLEWLGGEVRRLKDEGFLPIVTFQAFELCDENPHSSQRVLADEMVEAGAIIVSGSQAHCPQAYRVEGNTFIHYGLGNFWFDQMDWPTRQEILDRHVFYDGRHISTEILTAMLEDSSKPRPTTLEERISILERVFDASQW